MSMILTDKQAKDYVNSHIELVLDYDDATKNKHRADDTHIGFCCPVCGSGSGENGTGITSSDGKHWRCWRGCLDYGNKNGKDVFDIIGLMYNLTNFTEKFYKACQIFDIKIASGKSKISEDLILKKPVFQKKMLKNDLSKNKIGEKDYTSFLKFCAYHLKEDLPREYLKKRNIPFETAVKFGLGYHDNFEFIDGLKIPCLIIPNSKHSFNVRRLDSNEQPKYKKIGKQRLFAPRSLEKNNGVVFVTEGEINALSFMGIGARATAILTTANVKYFIDYLEKNKTEGKIILAFDNDDAGREATQKAAYFLKELGKDYAVFNNYFNYNDVNDLYANNEKMFFNYANSFYKH